MYRVERCAVAGGSGALGGRFRASQNNRELSYAIVDYERYKYAAKEAEGNTVRYYTSPGARFFGETLRLFGT